MLKDRVIIGIAIILVGFLFLNDTNTAATASSVSVNGTAVSDPNFIDGDVEYSVSGSDITPSLASNSVDSAEIAADAVGTSELNLTGTTPQTGHCILVASTTTASFESDTCPGGGADSFKTWDTPAGTNPVADSSTDTMTATSTDGVLTITGADNPESIDFTAGAEMLTESELDTEAELEAQLADATQVYTDNDPSITTLTGPLSAPTHLTFTPQSGPAHTEGRIYYDSDDDTLVIFNAESDVSLNVGEENFVFVRNQTGSTITDGQAVYVSGQSGNTPLVSLAQANSTTTARAIGLATHSIENNTFGYITTFGIVRDLNTAAFSVGDVLFLSDSVAGGLTTSKPDITVFMGNVLVSHATQGRILVSTRAPLTLTALGADTTGDYVAGIIEGTTIDVTGSGGEGSTPTVAFDSTEVGSTIWGSGSTFSWTFDSGVTDVVINFLSDAITTEASMMVGQILNIDDEGEIRLSEEDANGANWIALKAPTNIATTRTCTLEDDTTPVDPCVTPEAITAGRSLTRTADDIAADSELFTDVKTAVITAATTTLTNLVHFEFATTVTITRVSCSTDTGTVTIQLDERVESTPNTPGTNVLTSSLVCDTDTQITTAFSNASIAGRVPLNLQILATTGVTPSMRLHVEFTKDD